MPTRPPVFRANGVRPKRERDQAADKRRGSARERGYGTAWDKAAKGWLRRSPLCRYCEVGAFGEPALTPAGLVDHLYPHGGDQTLFWAKVWWVSSCKPCHDGPKQAADRRGPVALDPLARRLDLPTRG